MYGIVQFPGQEHGNPATAIVLKKWLTPRKTEVYWPPVKESNKFHNLLEKCSSPDDRWKLYDIDKVVYETDDLDKAKKKLKLAEDTSDLQTDATELEYEPKRRITKTHHYVSSDDEQQEGDLIRPPPLKKICKEYKTLSSPVPVIEVIGNENEAMNISLSGQQKQLDTNCFNEGVIFNEDRFDETICNQEAKNDKTISINYLMDTSLLLNNVEDLFPTSTPTSTFRKYTSKVTRFQEKVISILSYIKNQNAQILTILKGTITTADLDSCFDFPVKSEEEIKTTEEILKNVDKYKNLVNYIKSFGEHGVSNKVSRAMKSLLLDSVAAKYNLCGKRSNKKAFSELRLQNLVDAIVCSKLGITARHVEDHIKVWLKHAPERNKTRNVSKT